MNICTHSKIAVHATHKGAVTKITEIVSNF